MSHKRFSFYRSPSSSSSSTVFDTQDERPRTSPAGAVASSSPDAMIASEEPKRTKQSRFSLARYRRHREKNAGAQHQRQRSASQPPSPSSSSSSLRVPGEEVQSETEDDEEDWDRPSTAGSTMSSMSSKSTSRWSMAGFRRSTSSNSLNSWRTSTSSSDSSASSSSSYLSYSSSSSAWSTPQESVASSRTSLASVNDDDDDNDASPLKDEGPTRTVRAYICHHFVSIPVVTKSEEPEEEEEDEDEEDEDEEEVEEEDDVHISSPQPKNHHQISVSGTTTLPAQENYYDDDDEPLTPPPTGRFGPILEPTPPPTPPPTQTAFPIRRPSITPIQRPTSPPTPDQNQRPPSPTSSDDGLPTPPTFLFTLTPPPLAPLPLVAPTVPPRNPKNNRLSHSPSTILALWEPIAAEPGAPANCPTCVALQAAVTHMRKVAGIYGPRHSLTTAAAKAVRVARVGWANAEWEAGYFEIRDGEKVVVEHERVGGKKVVRVAEGCGTIVVEEGESEAEEGAGTERLWGPLGERGRKQRDFKRSLVDSYVPGRWAPGDAREWLDTSGRNVSFEEFWSGAVAHHHHHPFGAASKVVGGLKKLVGVGKKSQDRERGATAAAASAVAAVAVGESVID